MHVLFLLQNKFGLVFFRLFDGALEISNFLFEEARSAITLLRCFVHENTQRGKIARVKFTEELGTMSKNRLRWITLVRGPIWGIHSLTLMISCFSTLNDPITPGKRQNIRLQVSSFALCARHYDLETSVTFHNKVINRARTPRLTRHTTHIHVC